MIKKILLVFALTFSAAPVFAQNTIDPPLITVTGQAEILVVPDEVANFRTTQSRKYKDQARAMAMKAAQEKAIAMAREIGQTIGKAYSIQERRVA